MHYIVCGGDRTAASKLLRSGGVSPLADGELLVLEGPWPIGPTSLGFSPGAAPPSPPPQAGAAGLDAFAVEGFETPGDGGAFVIAAHRMIDAERFRPYAEAIPDLLRSFGVRSLARGGKVTRLAGSFAPDRGVVLEFASVKAVLDFYMSEVYAPLLALRLATTDPRFAVIARSGTISEAERRRVADFLAAKSG